MEKENSDMKFSWNRDTLQMAFACLQLIVI